MYDNIPKHRIYIRINSRFTMTKIRELSLESPALGLQVHLEDNNKNSSGLLADLQSQ